MPEIHELYGFQRTDDRRQAERCRHHAQCPFTGARCDGGGNRYQTRVKFDKRPELRERFHEDIDGVIPGVCSIDYGNDEQWIVCPRRLFGFKRRDKTGLPIINESLQPHEEAILREAGLPQDTVFGVFPEVYLRYATEDASINYHFDFVLLPLVEDTALHQLWAGHDVSREDVREIIDCARQGGWVSGRVTSNTTLPLAPDVGKPWVVEVMTASTSGSNSTKGTDIAAAFADAMLGRPHTSPGINKRQVWGRMATQLFSKSALAEAWGGRALWVIQDKLLENIENTTSLDMTSVETGQRNQVNFVSVQMAAHSGSPGESVRLCSGSAGIEYGGNRTCADLLLPKTIPPKTELLKSVFRRSLAARVELTRSRQ